MYAPVNASQPSAAGIPTYLLEDGFIMFNLTVCDFKVKVEDHKCLQGWQKFYLFLTLKLHLQNLCMVLEALVRQVQHRFTPDKSNHRTGLESSASQQRTG